MVVESKLRPVLMGDFPERTEEGEYLDRFLYVFGGLDLRQTLEWGLATMGLLELGEIRLDSGKMLEDLAGFTPSLMEIAALVAAVYSSVSSDPYWWRERYFDTEREHEVNLARKKLAELLRRSAKVKEVAGI